MTLPTSYSWALPASAAAVSPLVIPSFVSTSGPGATECNGVYLDEAYFLSLFERRLPYSYLQPLKVNSDSGYEILKAAAQTFARVSKAIERMECGNIIMFSQGGALSTGTVEFSRPTATAGAVTVGSGTIVSCSASGRQFRTLQDAVFGALDVGPVEVGVEALAYGWQYDVLGKYITPISGIELEGEIDTIDTIIQIDPATGLRDFLDDSIWVTNIDATSGGEMPMLDGLGEDRGIQRGSGEADAVFRYRIRSLPDTVTPNSIIAALDELADAWGVTYEFIETFEPELQTCFDFPSPNAGTPTYMAGMSAELIAMSKLFVYDDPRAPEAMVSRWLDGLSMRATFIVRVTLPPALQDFGRMYDSTDTNTASRATAAGTVSGRFAISAFDVPTNLTEIAGCYDGWDSGLRGFLSAWYQTLQKLKAAGVAAVLWKAGN